MPQKLWLTHVGEKRLKLGDYVLFRFHDYRMTDLTDFEYVIKQVGGVAGNKIVVKSGDLASNPSTSYRYLLPDGQYPIFDILSGNHFTPLTTKDMIIPNGSYFVHGQQHPSFDSRYLEFGLLTESQIYGKSYPIF
jgi:type IV secretory pathway protease TraF